jgi:hypothetical protein
MKKLKDIQNYLENERVTYQVECHWFNDKEYSVGIIDIYIKNDILKVLINEFEMQLEDGFIFGIFKK